MPAGVLECVIDNAAHALTRVDFELSRDLVRSSLFEDTTPVDVGTLRVFADDGKINVLGADSFQRAETFVKEAHRTHIRIKVQAETKCEENLRSVPLIRNARITNGPEQNRIEIFPKHFKRARGQ